MEPTVLAVNPGSSSREYALYRGHEHLLSGYYEHDTGSYTLTFDDGEKNSIEIDEADFEQALAHFLAHAESAGHSRSDISAVGVRLVAPGRRFLEHAELDDELYGYLQQHQQKAPLHIAQELAQIDQLRQQLGDTPIFLISDSAFHKSLSHEARNYAIPRDDAHDHDIYRFGYHGISLKSVVHNLKEEQSLDYPRMIICHLGSGSSITAVKDWQSIDTSMGYSPLEGLVMATRSGTIDVEAALELKKQLSLDDSQLIGYLNQQSGLLGVSGSSNDIRVLLAQEKDGDENAKLALDMMVYRIRQYIGAYHAVLGGLDALVFTATVGERSAVIRRRICESMGHIGIELDTFSNDTIDSTNALISTEDSPVKVHVVITDETAEIVRQTHHLLARD